MLRKNHPHGGRVLSLFMKKKEHQIQGLNSRALRPDGVGSLKFRTWSQSPPVTPGRHPAQHLRASSLVPQGQTQKSHSFCPRGMPGTGQGGGGGLIFILYLGFKPSFLPTP